MGEGGGVRVKRRRSPYTFHFSILSRPNNYCMRFHWTLDSRTDVSIPWFPRGISAIYLAFPTVVFPRQVGRFRKDNPASNDNAKAAKATERDFRCPICHPVIPCHSLKRSRFFDLRALWSLCPASSFLILHNNCWNMPTTHSYSQNISSFSTFLAEPEETTHPTGI